METNIPMDVDIDCSEEWYGESFINQWWNGFSNI